MGTMSWETAEMLTNVALAIMGVILVVVLLLGAYYVFQELYNTHKESQSNPWAPPLKQDELYEFVEALWRVGPSLRPHGVRAQWHSHVEGCEDGWMTAGPLKIDCSFTPGGSSRCPVDYTVTSDFKRVTVWLGEIEITHTSGLWWVEIRRLVTDFMNNTYSPWCERRRQWALREDALDQERLALSKQTANERLRRTLSSHVDALRDLNAQNGDE